VLFKNRAHTTVPKTLNLASLLGQKVGLLGQWPRAAMLQNVLVLRIETFLEYLFHTSTKETMLALRVTEIKLTGDGGPAGKGLVTPALPYHNHPTYSALFPL